MKIKLFKSFKCAFKGISHALEEQTIKIFFVMAFLVIALMIFFETNLIEKALLLLCITVVLSLELINSQVEKTLDIVSPEFSEKVRKIKDISAGAVLIASLGSAIVGLLIFLPYFFSFLKQLY
jgi:diacylglycerol kinase